MNFSTTFTNKLIAITLYSCLLLVTVSAGEKALNHTRDRMFIVNFITGWEQVVIKLQEKEPKLPMVQKKQVVTGMNTITLLAKKHSITLPSTNTKYSYTYILKKINQPDQHIFLRIDQDKFIIYGLQRQTMERIDRQIDGHKNLQAGRFTAKRTRNTTTFIGILSL